MTQTQRGVRLIAYPTVSLADARLKFNEASALFARGIDPQVPPPLQCSDVPQEELTVSKLAELWVTKWSQKHHSVKWANTLKLALEKDILPIYGNRLASNIRRRDAVAILEEKAAAAPGQAMNLHKALRGMFQYALDREMVEFNPFAAISPAKSIPAMRQKKPRTGTDRRRDKILLDCHRPGRWVGQH